MATRILHIDLLTKVYSKYQVTVDTKRIKPFSTYLYTELFFDSPQFVYNKSFLKQDLSPTLNLAEHALRDA